MFWKKKLKLSKKELEQFRKNLLSIYLEPGEIIELSNPDTIKHFGVSNITVEVVGTYPLFKWHQIQQPEDKVPFKYESIIKVPEPHPEFLVVIIKSLANYMPYKPKDNYLQNKGECIV